MNLIKKLLRGMVIGVANLIPGVSGGTMMVTMGIYDTLIHCITHLFKEFKKSVLTLLPYVIGMLIAIGAGAFGLKKAFEAYPLQTNAFFIGLILGSVPIIFKEFKNEKKGVPGLICFLFFLAVVVLLKVFESENRTEIVLSVWEVIKLFFLGCIASGTMVIPGVSGSMMLKTLGYYEPIVTNALPACFTGLMHGDWNAVLSNIGVLLPFALGIVAGIFGVAKLIELLLSRFKGVTYCGILGMVVASPIVILMEKSIYENVIWETVSSSIAIAVIGFVIATKLGGNPDTVPADTGTPENTGT